MGRSQAWQTIQCDKIDDDDDDDYEAAALDMQSNITDMCESDPDKAFEQMMK